MSPSPSSPSPSFLYKGPFQSSSSFLIQSAGPSGAHRVPEWAESQDWGRGSQLPLPLQCSHSAFHPGCWAFSKHVGSYGPWTALPGQRGGISQCCLPFHLIGTLPQPWGSAESLAASASQPLLLQCPSFLSRFLCLQCGIPPLSLSLSDYLQSLSPSLESGWGSE